jgi:hypothetical protein
MLELMAVLAIAARVGLKREHCEGNQMLPRLIAAVLVPLGVNLNWVFAPRLSWKVSRGSSRSLEECRRAALTDRRQE